MSLGVTFSVMKIGVLEILARLRLIEQEAADEAALEHLERYGALDEDLSAGWMDQHSPDVSAMDCAKYVEDHSGSGTNIYGLPLGVGWVHIPRWRR